MSRVRLVVMRHGQSIANVEQRYAGSSDVELTPLGELQAKQAGDLLRECGFQFDAVLTSELSRARKTAQIVLAGLRNSPLPEVAAMLNERRFGELEGMKFTDAANIHGEAWGDPWLWGQKPPGGESMEDLAHRLRPLVEEVLKPALDTNKRLLLVAHGNTICVLDELLHRGKQSRLDRVPPATPFVYSWDVETREVVEREILRPY